LPRCLDLSLEARQSLVGLLERDTIPNVDVQALRILGDGQLRQAGAERDRDRGDRPARMFVFMDRLHPRCRLLQTWAV
jgi:hypothetical protein